MPLASWDDPRADALLAEAEILVGHWGCPTLTGEVLDRAPNLRLFAYGAGTVKWQVTDAVWDRSIVVTSAAAANATPVAEYAIAAILLANKGVFLVRELQRDPSRPVPLDLGRVGNCGARVGIVGASFVGRLVIEGLREHRPRGVGVRPVPVGRGSDRLGRGEGRGPRRVVCIG